MRFLKIFGITLLVIISIIIVLMTLYFLFANQAYGIDVLTRIFKDGFFGGIKNFFVELWKGILYVFDK